MNVPQKDGIYPGLSYDEYAMIDGINQSYLKEFAKSARTARYWASMGGREQTQAMKFGRALHLAILEPQNYDSEIMAIPKLNKSTKAGKAAWINFQRASEGRITMDPDERDRIRHIAQSIIEHPSAADLFRNRGANEVSIVWTDPETGLRCKARIDRLTEYRSYTAVMDMKSCQDIEKRAFQATVKKMGYDIQGGFTLMGLDVLRPIANGAAGQRVFAWLAVETEGPFEVGVYEMVDEARRHAQQRVRRMLREIKKCRETGIWPGKCGDGIELLDLAEWVYKQEPLEDN